MRQVLYQKRLLQEGEENIRMWINTLRGSLHGLMADVDTVLEKLGELEATQLTFKQRQILDEVIKILTDQGLDPRYEKLKKIKEAGVESMPIGNNRARLLPSGQIIVEDLNGSILSGHQINDPKWDELADLFLG